MTLIAFYTNTSCIALAASTGARSRHGRLALQSVHAAAGGDRIGATVSHAVPTTDTYRARSEFLELRTHARRLTDENERLRHRLAGCAHANARPRRRVDGQKPVAAAAPSVRRRVACVRAPADSGHRAGVKDLIKNYRRALRRADARAVDLQARAQAAEARAVAAERRAAAAELERAAEAEARAAEAPRRRRRRR